MQSLHSRPRKQKNKWWCAKSLKMCKRKSRNGERKKRKWLVTADGKSKNKESGKWSSKETILWKTEQGLHTDTSLINPPEGAENKSTPFVGNLENIHIHDGKKVYDTPVWLCANHAIWPSSWYNADILVITKREDLGGERAAQSWTVSQLSAWVPSFA